MASDVHRITPDGEEMRAWWSRMVETRSKWAILAQNSLQTITESVCSALVYDDAEHLGQVAIVEDTAPPRMLSQAVTSPSPVDTTVETTPDVVSWNLPASTARPHG